jgi:hypothetical protein
MREGDDELMRSRSAGNAVAILSLAIGCSAVIVWLITGRLSLVVMIALSVGSYGLGIVSSWFSGRMIKRLKRGPRKSSDNTSGFM